ncbi:uncharacterized protein VP01_666g14 [Puccinia sorghi]|uniref:Retrotransposon gag domain-containing protein n=1 Tax=Puccinia sorghi TaxID=27349 RepID=A0A0L6UEY6_9BASI|nr:uncharacterized protein VP01_666g14 [Puccinia sorghi]
MALCLPNPNPSMGTAANLFVGQISLHAVTYPKRFPTDASKVVFAISFMKDYAATWSHPYLKRVFNGELVVFNNFLNDFKSSFFDHNRQNCTKLALLKICQT